MFSKTAIGLAAALLVLAAGAFTPAMANYAPCYENPAAKGCPNEINQNTSAQTIGAQNIRCAQQPAITASCGSQR
jgi:hypothetical protein